jgi:hypothetical protein
MEESEKRFEDEGHQIVPWKLDTECESILQPTVRYEIDRLFARTIGIGYLHLEWEHTGCNRMVRA